MPNWTNFLQFLNELNNYEVLKQLEYGTPGKSLIETNKHKQSSKIRCICWTRVSLTNLVRGSQLFRRGVAGLECCVGVTRVTRTRRALISVARVTGTRSALVVGT